MHCYLLVFLLVFEEMNSLTLKQPISEFFDWNLKSLSRTLNGGSSPKANISLKGSQNGRVRRTGSLDRYQRTTLGSRDHAVYQLTLNDSATSEQLEYVDFNPEVMNDQLRLVEISEKNMAKREVQGPRMSLRDAGNGDEAWKSERELLSVRRSPTFDEYFREYKIKRTAIEDGPEAIEFKKYLQDKRGSEMAGNGNSHERKPRYASVQSLHEINQFFMTALQTVKSWMVYEENGKTPEPRISYERLLKAFDLYYECLLRRFNLHKENLGRPMNDVLSFNAMSNEKIVIECKTCIPPYTSGRNYGLVWYRRLLMAGGPYQHLPEDETLYSMSADGDLTVHMLRPADAGMYTCFKGDAHEASYLIGVDDSEGRIRVYEDTDTVARATQPVILAQFNLYVFYQWSTWSDCNRCNGKGTRKRVGTCMVKKFDKRLPIRPRDSTILRKYTNGLPCISPLIPHFIYKDAELSERRTELMIATCFNACITKPPVKVITDENGKRLDVVKVFKGRHSFYEGVPQLGTPIERITRHATLNRKFTISCPHENATKISVRWQNGTLILEESKMGYMTNFRVKINAKNEIVIKRVMRFDEGYYSCWHNLQHLGTVRLYTVESFDWRFYWDLCLRQLGLLVCCVSFIYLLLRLIVLRCRVPQQFK